MFHHRDHRIASADGRHPYLEEDTEELSLLLTCHSIHSVCLRVCKDSVFSVESPKKNATDRRYILQSVA